MKKSQNPLTIFYTDDDADDQHLFKEVMADIAGDHRIYTQNHGDELLEMLSDPPPSPNIIFLDLNMPVKNGYEVLKEMRRPGAFADIPVVVFSTSDDKQVVAMTKELGADMFVSKPASYNELKHTVKAVLSKDWSLGAKPADHEFLYSA